MWWVYVAIAVGVVLPVVIVAILVRRRKAIRKRAKYGIADAVVCYVQANILSKADAVVDSTSLIICCPVA